MGVVEEFVARYAAHDWDGLMACLSPREFVRVGPYVDVIEGRDAYLAFLRRVVPILKEGYELRAEHVAYAGDTAVAQLVEHLDVDGTMTDIPEAIVFRLDGEGLITTMYLYLQQPGGEPPAGGREAMGGTR